MQAHDALDRGLEPGKDTRPAAGTRPAPRRESLIVAAVALLLSAAAFGFQIAVHRHQVVTWFDLDIYLKSGQHAQHHPAILYTWQVSQDTKFVYTPFAAIIFWLVSDLPRHVAQWGMSVLSFIAVLGTVWLTLGGMNLRGRARLVPALAAGAASIWIWPIVWSFHLGQIEPLLMLLVVWDLTQPDRRRWKGLGVGLAAGIKLVPLIFIPYLLLAGKARQAAVATGTFALTVLIGWITLPGPSRTWWLSGYLFDTSKNGSNLSLVNQSLNGMLSRAAGSAAGARLEWLLLAGIVGLVGVAAAALLHRAGQPVQGMMLVAITALLVSPISWDNHWVWIAPLMAMLAGLAVQAAGRARWMYAAATAALFAIFAGWPRRYSGPHAFVPERALLGWFVRTGSKTFRDVSDLQGTQLLTWNLYVIVGLVVFAVMLIPAWRARRKHPSLPLVPRPRTAADSVTPVA